MSCNCTMNCALDKKRKARTSVINATGLVELFFCFDFFDDTQTTMIRKRKQATTLTD